MTEELKPCAHCGANAYLIDDRQECSYSIAIARIFYYVICQGCKIATDNEKESQIAIDKWNKRV